MRGLVIYFTVIFTIDLVPAEDSYSFHKFSGPVSGEVKRVVVPGSNPHIQESKIDYVAKPDYSFSYGVQDGKTGNSHTHQESRDGDAVHGEYRVLQSDGKVRIVRYTAHPNTGFQATVEYADVNDKNVNNQNYYNNQQRRNNEEQTNEAQNDEESNNEELNNEELNDEEEYDES